MGVRNREYLKTTAYFQVSRSSPKVGISFMRDLAVATTAL